MLSAPRSIDEMWAELTTQLEGVRDPHLRVLLNRIAADHRRRAARVAGGAADPSRLSRRPARTRPQDGGDRPLSRAGIRRQRRSRVRRRSCCTTSASSRSSHYEPGGATYTRDGNLDRPHRARADPGSRASPTASPGFPTRCAPSSNISSSSHHGSHEHGSPVVPKTIEAFILAMVDELDTRIHQVRRAIGEDQTDGEFTGWHKRLGRVILQGPGATGATGADA